MPLKHHIKPRSYVVESGNHKFRHNRRHLRPSFVENKNENETFNWEDDKNLSDSSIYDKSNVETKDSDKLITKETSVSVKPDGNKEQYITRSGRTVVPPKKNDG